MVSFGNKCIFLNMLFLLLGPEVVFSDEQCDCESLSLLTKFVQQEIFQMKIDIMKLRLDFTSVSTGRNAVTQTPSGTIPIIGVSDSEKGNPNEAVKQWLLDYLDKQLEVKLQPGCDERQDKTNDILRKNSERNAIFRRTITNALKKEKTERVHFMSHVQLQMEYHKQAFVEFKTNAENMIDTKIEAHVQTGQKFEKNISENFEDFKNAIYLNLEENVLKTGQDLQSQRNDTKLFEKHVTNDLDKFKTKVRNDIETAENQTAISITNLLNTVKNSTKNIDKCTSDIVTIQDVINNIASDNERDKKAFKDFRDEFDDSIAKMDRLHSFIAEKVELDRDCKDILRTKPKAKSGQYTIFLRESKKLLSVYCDMETDGGGWTVFQRRFNGDTDFDRNYTEYETGFGSVTREFWLGLENIQELASQGITELRLDVTTFTGLAENEIIEDFKLLDDEYIMQLGSHAANSGFTGYFGMFYDDRAGFSTYDHDVDTDKSGNCASQDKGGWWYKECSYVNLNGVYSTSWPCMYHFGLGPECMKSSKMMLRRTT